MNNENSFLVEAEKLRLKVDKLFIYGAGLYARNIYGILNEKGILIDGFIVTCVEKASTLYELPILSAESVLHDNIGIVIGTNSLNRVGIIEKLRQADFNMAYVVYGTDYIEKSGLRYDGSPTMQITTKIGCSVNCKYCPQNLLLRKYYSDNKNRISIMSLEIFEQCLSKLPRNARISFCGMAEPFLNPKCGEMIKLAYESGRIIELYTTLVGADRKTLEKIAEIPFGYVTLHVADKYGYAHIPLTNEYYDMVEFVINYKRKDGTALVNMCNAQAEPDGKIAQICKGKYEILTALHDRAGNLEGAKLLNKDTPKGKIACSLCGERLNHNNLLPDGTVLLCDFDYGMQHVLGNLLEQSYSEIMLGSEWNRVHKGMSDDLERNILCRKCSCANSVI